MKEQFLVIAIIVASVWLGSEVLSIANRSTGAKNWLAVVPRAANLRHRLTGGTTSWSDDETRTGRHYLGICVTFKDQHEDVREWIEHHTKGIGASTVYLYDNLSDPPLKSRVADYIAAGTVQYTWWEHSQEYYEDLNTKLGVKRQTHNAQKDMLTDCLRTYGRRHQFLGLLDSDEYLIVTDNSPSVADQLRRMMAWETIGGLAVFWRVFGSSGHETRPPEGVLKGYTKCANSSAPYSSMVKTIANTDFAIEPLGHIVKLNSTAVHVVTEHFQPVTAGRPGYEPSWEHLAMHHYITKSRADFAAKTKRRAGDGSRRNWKEFDRVNRLSTDDCSRFVDRYGPYV